MEGTDMNDHLAGAKYQAYQGIAYDYMSRHEEIARRDILKSVVSKRKSDTKGCMFLPIAIGFFVLYAESMRLHEDVSNVFFLESSIRHTVEGSLEDLKTISDFWDWLHGDFIDIMFVQKDPYGNTLPEKEWSRLLLYSQVQGAVILTQARAKSTEAVHHRSDWGKALAGPLPAHIEALHGANQGFLPLSQSRRLDVLREEMRDVLPGSVGDDSTYEFTLYPSNPLMETHQRAQYLEDRNWVDTNTNEVQVRVLILNAELGHPCLERLLIRISFSRGGGIFWRVTLQSLFLESHSSTASLLVDLLWLLMLIGTSCWLLLEIWKAVMARRFMVYISKGSTMIEVSIMVMGWMIVAAFAALQIVYMKAVRADLAELRRITLEEEGSGGGSSAEAQASEVLHNSVEAAFAPLSNYQTVSSWYTLFLMFRFFLAFKAQPRLALVTNTLKATTVDLLHFLAFFTPTFVAYVISGSLLFGRRLEEFSTVRASVGTCFRILIENEFEWDLLSEEHFLTTAIWVWSYLLIVVLIMLNMVLAIILDIYNDVRQKVDSADTIFLFFRNIGKRAWLGRHWVTDAELDMVVSGMNGSTTVTKEDLREIIPKMSGSQVDMLFSACKNTVVFNLKQEMHRAAFLKMSASIKGSIDKVNHEIAGMNQSEANSNSRAGTNARTATEDKDNERDKKKRERSPEEKGSRNSSKEQMSIAQRRMLGLKETVRLSKYENRRSKSEDPKSLKRSSTLDSAGRSSTGSKESSGARSGRSRSGGRHLEDVEFETSRMAGSARPFPGMPKVPGGCNPPLLSPDQATNEIPDPMTRPSWLRDLDSQMDTQDKCMMAIQAELQQLQWRLHSATQNLASAIGKKHAESVAAGTHAHRLPVVNGVPIL